MTFRTVLARVLLPAMFAGSQGTLPYVRRGDEVEARYRAHVARLSGFLEEFRLGLRNEPDLVAKLEAAAPQPVASGYRVLPRILPDGPPPAMPMRSASVSYSWRRTDGFLDMDQARLAALEQNLARLRNLSGAAARSLAEEMVVSCQVLAGNQRIIDHHIKYNRFWQREIAADRDRFDANTVLHDAVVERQAILDALGAADEESFRKVLAAVPGMGAVGSQTELEPALRGREQALLARIRKGIVPPVLPPFCKIETRRPHRLVLRVRVYTDIGDGGFLRAFKDVVENVWRFSGPDEEYRVALEIRRLSPRRLYAGSEGCRKSGRDDCRPPAAGAPVDLQKHVALFPADGAVLTTGAITTHALPRRTINLGPQEIPRNTLAHEFGHLLGFGDGYFRGCRDLGADGFEVLEIGTDPQDIMSNPGHGRVTRAHFQALLSVPQSARFQKRE